MNHATTRTSPAPVFALCLMATAAAASADGVSTVVLGGQVERVSAGGTTLAHTQLAPGVSTGATDQADQGGFALRSADGRNLSTYFARQNTSPDWDVALGTWQDANDDGYDFFVFEVGGGDSITVAPRFPDGTYGQEVAVGGWTSTGYQVPQGPNAGQTVYGVAIRSTQLKDAAGQPLTNAAVLAGVRVRSATVDGASFLAHRPDPDGAQDGKGEVTLAGTARVGHLVELVYRGPWMSETGLAPNNPFLDRRLDVLFTSPSGNEIRVPGFFDADGAGGETGTIWKVRFRPPGAGLWKARARFRVGPDVAVSLDPLAGQPGLLDGVLTKFEVAPVDFDAPGFLGKGRLLHVGEHYPRHQFGEWYLKVGTNSPENFLAYRGFDGVGKLPGAGGVVHDYAPHAGDWAPGDPLFESRDHDVDSRGIVGALNYLAAQGVNSLHTLPMNLGGDAQDVHPFLTPDDEPFARTHYDTSRLAQWHVVFEHAAKLGIALHFSLAETEPQNENWLDGGQFGVERKLYFRELIARFGHHPAILWTLCEENDFPVAQLRDMADWFEALDPWDHPVTFHNHVGDFADYQAVAGEERFSATALQFDGNQAGNLVETMRDLSAGAGHPWLVGAVEVIPYWEGITDSNHDEQRKNVLWDVLLSGGHIEWYAGWHGLPLGGDLTLEDFRTREEMWEDMRHAAEFLRTLPFHRMQPADGLASGGKWTQYGGPEVFADGDDAWAIYLPDASGTPTLDLSGNPGEFELRWFDPRVGVFAGTATTLQGGGTTALGNPPYAAAEDWVARVERVGSLSADVATISVSQGGTQALTLDVGTANAGRRYLLLGTMSGQVRGFKLGSIVVPLDFDRYTRWTQQAANGAILQDTFGVVDAGGLAQMSISLQPGQLAPLAGTTLYHAAVLLDPVDTVSSVTLLQLVP